MAKTSFKQKYYDLRKSREKTLLGAITGGLNRIFRSAVPLAANATSAIAAFMPMLRGAGYIMKQVTSPAGSMDGVAIGANMIVADATGVDARAQTFDYRKPLWNIVAIGAPQVAKKVVQKVGSF